MNTKKIFHWYLIVLACLCAITGSFAADSSPDQSINIPSVKKIRVLLDEKSAHQETKLLIKSKDGFVLESPAGSGNTAIYRDSELRLVCREGQLYLKCHDQKYRHVKYDSIEICDQNNKLTLGSRTYQGSLILRVDRATKTLLTVNKLPLEDYVYSVVRCEGIPSWPQGMQKIQAIISRTYAVFLMQQARLKNPRYRFYDIKNTNLHQVYNGTHNYTHLRQAVNETEGLILTYKNRIALAMFDICCGGSVPALMRNRDKSKPYLCRKEKCTFCSAGPAHRWKEDLHVDSFLKRLKNNPRLAQRLKNFKGSISAIKVTDCDKAGIVHKVKIYDKHKTPFMLTGVDIRGSMIADIKSLNFVVKKVRDRIVFTGKGYGHQCGACQWGCKWMVENGWSTKGILSFYYPGTKLSRLL
ncbi:MAG: SpoIID/LytB domain-containing protein [Candidatus Babeliales bacterium]|jgi:stage II sporulation protein D